MRARRTSGGTTWDLRPQRQPGGNPASRKKLPAAEADVRRHLDYNLAQMVAALRDGREDRAWELVREARALASRLPRESAKQRYRKIKAATILLRAKTWRI